MTFGRGDDCGLRIVLGAADLDKTVNSGGFALGFGLGFAGSY